jgi:hypothetical protein
LQLSTAYESQVFKIVVPYSTLSDNKNERDNRNTSNSRVDSGKNVCNCMNPSKPKDNIYNAPEGTQAASGGGCQKRQVYSTPSAARKSLFTRLTISEMPAL